jgi:anti-sigma factor RsiW
VTCRELAEFMMAYLDGELDASLRRRFEEHLAGCAECVRALREYRATVRAGQLAYADEPPADVPEELVKAILTGNAAKRG